MPDAGIEVATKASNSLIENGVLGTILVLCILGIVALIWVLVRLMNKRVEDIRAMAALSENMAKTFSEISATLKSMNDLEKDQRAQLQRLLDITTLRGGGE